MIVSVFLPPSSEFSATFSNVSSEPGGCDLFQVDGEVVAERTVIAQAIPPSGSLWLGCRPRDRPPGAVLGEVELYLFRMWPDLSDRGLCEDGTVIGWNARYWGLTSSNARQSDPSLLCGETDMLVFT